MQFDDTTSQTNLREHAEKKEETNILNDQENIRRIVKEHPYKRWESILNGRNNENGRL